MREDTGLGVLAASVVASTTPLSAARQRVIAALDPPGGPFDAAVALLGRADLDPSLDAELATVDDAAVRAAWLCSPGRSRVAIVEKLRGERRSSVLDAAATIDGLPDDVYVDLLERSSGVRTALELLRPSMSPSVRHMALAVCVQQEGITREVWGAVSTWLSRCSGCRAAVLAAATDLAVLSVTVARSTPQELDDETAWRLLDRCIGWLESATAACAPHTSDIVEVGHTAFSLMVLCPAVEVRRAEFADRFDAAAGSLVPNLHEYGLPGIAAELRDIPLLNGVPLSSVVATVFGPAGVSRRAAVESLRSVGGLTSLLSRTVENVLATACMSGAVSEEVPQIISDQRIKRAVLVRRLARRGGLAPDVAVVVAQAARSPELISEALLGSSDPQEAIRRFASDPVSPLSAVVALVAAGAFDDPELIPFLPVGMLCGGAGGSEAVAVAAGRASLLVLDAAADDPGAFRLAEELARSSKVTVGDLCQMVSASLSS